MTIHTRFDNLGYYVWLNGQIGPPLTYIESEIIVSWLNNTKLFVYSYSFFSYEAFINDKNEEYYYITDTGKKIGDAIKEKREVVAIVSWLNSCIPQLKERLDAAIYDPIIGDDPSESEIRNHMRRENIGYYDALEELRKKTYKKL
jgi:hypothetical protein